MSGRRAPRECTETVLRASGLTDEPFSVTFRLANEGVSSATGTSIQRVLLSKDTYLGDDTVLGNFELTGSLLVGTYNDRTVSLRRPNVPGDYWIIGIADATGLRTRRYRFFISCSQRNEVRIWCVRGLRADPDGTLAGI